MLNRILELVTKRLEAMGRKRVILDRREESVYLERYYILFAERAAKFKWFPFNLLLHHICRSDEDEMHDHPWWNASLILRGGYWENTPEGRFWRSPGYIGFRRATALHKLEIDRERAGDETWTLFLVGPRIRDWGFVKDGQWTQWQQFLEAKQGDRPIQD